MLIETNTSDVINHIVDKASAGLDQITSAISKHAPEAWALACKGVYISGLGQLIVASLCLVIFLVCLTIFSVGLNTGMKADKAPASEEDALFIKAFIMMVPSGVVGIIFFIGALVNGLDSSAYQKVLAPDGYLASQIIQTALTSKD